MCSRAQTTLDAAVNARRGLISHVLAPPGLRAGLLRADLFPARAAVRFHHHGSDPGELRWRLAAGSHTVRQGARCLALLADARLIG